MAYQIDRAVTTFGIIIDNALQETIPIGDEGKTVDKYTLDQLLDKKFLLPRKDLDTEPFEMVDGMKFDTV
jgi:hypothetical protein